MRLQLRTFVRTMKAGTEARAPELRLVSHGEDESEAIARLHNVVLTWCSCLQRVGELERALARHGVLWEPVGHNRIEIELQIESAS